MPTYDVTIPFIRMLAGPLDYTQGAMRNASKGNYAPVWSDPMSMGTRCHQLAEYVVFDAPFSMLCDAPTAYLQESECTEFIADVPTVWDETKILDGKVGEYVITVKSAAADNYEISFVSGKLTVEKKEVGLTWTEAESFYFNAKPQSVTAEATGMVNEDALTVTVVGGAQTAIGSYTAKATALTGAKAGNYKLPTEGVTKAYTIVAALDTVTAASANGALTASVSGLTVKLSGYVETDKDVTLTAKKGGVTLDLNGDDDGNDFRSYANDTNRTVDLLLEEFIPLPDSISLDPTSLTIETGEVSHIDATSTGSDVVWSVTAGTDKVELKNGDNKGVDVKGLAAGSATVTATVGTLTATCEVTVTVAQELTFNKVTSNLDDFSGTYLIVCESQNVAFDGSLSTVEVVSNNVPVTISNNSITGTFTHNVVTIAKVNGGYSIKTASGVYIGHTGSSNSLNQSDSPIVCSISVNDGAATIACGDYTLRYNGASNQNRFRFYTSGQTAVQLYKAHIDCSAAVQEFVNNYMHMSDDAYNGNGTGLCKSAGTYNAAKAALLALGADAIEEFKSNSDFDAAQARYEAWALANGDAAPYSQASGSGRILLLGTSTNSMSAVIIVSIIVGVAAVGLLLLKKKKATK